MKHAPSPRAAALRARPLRTISRRGLISSAVLAGVLAAAGVPVQAQRRGGVLRLALPGDPAAALLPQTSRAVMGRVLGQGAALDGLTEVTAGGELVGELAEGWEPSEGGRIWTLRLRPEARFHDGAPVRAADVAASWLAHRALPSPAAHVLEQVEAVELGGPHGLRLVLTGPNPDFPFLMADPHLVVTPEGQPGAAIGSGLYRLDAEGPGWARLLRVAEHWKDGRAGWFDAIEARVIPDGAERLAALIAGEVDVAAALPPDLAGEVREAGQMLSEAEGAAHVTAALPGGPEGWRAALDRRAVIAARLGGVGTPAADHPLGALHPGLALTASEGVGLPDGWLDRLELSLQSGRLTEEAAFGAALSPGGAWAGTLGQDPQVRALLAELRGADAPGRARLSRALQEIFVARGEVAVVAHVPHVDAHSPALAHPETVSGLLGLDGGRIAERWWFA